MRFFEGNSAVRAPMILAQWEFWAHRDPEAPWSPSARLGRINWDDGPLGSSPGPTRNTRSALTSGFEIRKLNG